MTTRLEERRKYHIAFDTKDTPGLIRAVAISINIEYVRDQSKVFRVNLNEDPLYPDLVKYVNANPAREKQR